MELKKRLFHRFTENFANRNSYWQKLHMKPTLQKIPGYKDGVSWNRSLWRHKSRSVKILYIKNDLTYRDGEYFILSGIYVFLKTFKASATVYNPQAPKSLYFISHIFVKACACDTKRVLMLNHIYNPSCSPRYTHFNFSTAACSHAQDNFSQSCTTSH